MLTSTYPLVHGNMQFDSSLSPDITTIPELVNQTHRAGVFAGMNFFDQPYGLSRGFDEVADLSKYKNKRECNQARAEEVVDEFKKWVDQDSAPFFSLLWFFDAHNPYLSANEGPLANKKMVLPVERYSREITYIINNINGIINYLDQKDLYDNTIIIITGDHGDINTIILNKTILLDF